MTQIIVGSATHQLFLGSLAPMVRAIGASLGPDGRAALFDAGNRVGHACSGVAIAREILTSGGLPGIAQKLFKETLITSDRDLGDGSARLALMAEASFRAGSRCVAAGISATRLADAFAPLREEIAAMIAGQQCEAGRLEDLAMSTGVDAAYAETLSAAFHDVGPSGTVELAASRDEGIATEISSGFVLDATVIGSAEPPGEALSLDDVHVIAADDIISDFGTLAPVIEGFASKKKSLLIVAREVNGPAFAALERNRKAGILSVVVLKPMDAGPRAAAIIEDLAIATGATLVAERSGLTLSALKPAMLGRAAGLRLCNGRAELRRPAGDPAQVEARGKVIEVEIKKNHYLSLDREHSERRRARILGRWAEIRVGGCSDYETDTLIATGRNALASMRSAARSGVISGGGHALSRVAGQIEARGGDAAAVAAGKVAAEGLRSIERQLDRNAGRGPGFSRMKQDQALKERWNEKAVRDPLRLTQMLIDQALSLAGLLLRVDAAVVR